MDYRLEDELITPLLNQDEDTEDEDSEDTDETDEDESGDDDED